NGGEMWTAGSTYDITWSYTGIARVRLEYATEGAAWTEIASNLDAASGTCAWTIPAHITNTTCRIRVTYASDSTITDISDNPFTILTKPAITVTAPNGGETWITGTTHNITWQSAGVDFVKIEYTPDGAHWTVIASSVNASAHGIPWTIPAVTAYQCFVRISSMTAPAAGDQSDSSFTLINPTLALTSPNGGEQWPAMRTFPVTWKAFGFPLVKLEYSTDNGNHWNLMADNLDASTGKYLWKIPETLSAKCLVRVSDRENAGRSDGSNAAFGIVSPPVMHVTAPNGGESWRCEGIRQILWTATRIDSIRIEYTLDGGKDWIILARSAPAAPGSFSWKLPNETSSLCMVRLTDVSDSTFTDTSDTSFIIQQYNLNAGFAVDADLRMPGNQGEESIGNMGGGTLVGFALYAKDWENATGFTVSLSWETSKAEFLPSSSGLSISGDERTVNGETFIPPTEAGILGNSLLGSGEDSRTGYFTKSYALTGKAAVEAPEGLVYLAVFRTAATFTAGDTLTIRAALTLADKEGVKRDLGVRFFTIKKGLLPPSNLTVADIPNDQGHRLRLAWTASPSEQEGMVSKYRVYRSRSGAFTAPVPLTRFAALDSLIFYEQRCTILIDSVSVGKTEFIDTFVPVNGAPYYYWVQAVGLSGASKAVISTIATAAGEVAQAPLEFRLGEARPNPFNPGTTIEYDLPGESAITLEVYNISGQKVATIERCRKSAGKHTVVWDARGLPSGVYFYTLRADGRVKTGKALLVK
ncbi:MAG: T9SS type A sorting domain-containing protein, partial [Candidatus Latescibacterota bacterium]